MKALSQQWRFDPYRPENAPSRGRVPLAGDAANEARRRRRESVRVVVEDTSWMATAACRGVNPDVMVPAKGDVRAEAIARAACVGCPVAAQCLEYALAHPEMRGVWGGLSDKQRRARRRERRAA